MRKAVTVLAIITGIAFLLMAGCADREQTKSLEMDRLQSDTGEFQFYDLEWKSHPDTAQRSLGITFGQPDTAGGFRIYRTENAYTWNDVTASITCEYRSDKLYAVTLLFMPEESEREEFWSDIKDELFNLYGTVEENVQTGVSERLNITTESENYLWEDQSSGDTLMSVSKFSVDGEFKYIQLSVYVKFTEMSKDKTAVINTHRLGSAKIADRIVVLDAALL